MKTGTLQWEQGFLVMKTGFSLWELTYGEFPVSLTGFGFAVHWIYSRCLKVHWQTKKKSWRFQKRKKPKKELRWFLKFFLNAYDWKTTKIRTTKKITEFANHGNNLSTYETGLFYSKPSWIFEIKANDLVNFSQFFLEWNQGAATAPTL